MKKLVAEVSMSTRKAVVTVDENAPVVCSLKKEGNGTYSIALAGKVEWPTKYMNIGSSTEDRVFETTDEKCVARKVASTSGKASSGASPRSKRSILTATISKHLFECVEVLRTMPEVTPEECAAIQDLACRLEKTSERARLEAQVAAIQAQIAALGE